MNPTMFCFMRTDLNSMNPGKAIAQGMHAANMIQSRVENMECDAKTAKAFSEWKSNLNFGRTLVFDANPLIIEAAYQKYAKLGIWVDVVDPTYPIDDGGTTHLVECHTCSGLFIANPPKTFSVWLADPPNSDTIHTLKLHP